MSQPPSAAAEATPLRRILRRFATVIGLAAVMLLAGATAASAHTRLTATSPAGSATLTTAPRQLTLTFDGAVVLGSRSVVVTGPDRRRADLTGTARTSGGRTVVVELRPGLATGSYGVLWRVASTDGHPTSGTFSFGLGAPAALPPDRRLVQGSALVGVLNGVAHAVGYLTLMVLVGAAFFCAFVGPAAPVAGRQRRLVRAAWLASVAAALTGYPLEAVDTFGLGPASVVAPHLWWAEAALRPGLLTLVRVLLLGLTLPILNRLLSTGRAPTAGGRVDIGAAGVALLSTVALAGHAATGQETLVSVLLDLTHLVAGSIWLGGLGMLLAGGRTSPGSPVIARWSCTAAVAIAAIVATGCFAAWREIGGVAAATGTTYGRWFIVKLAVVVTTLGLASRARGLVVGRPATGAPELLRRLVGLEFALGIGVLAVTSVITSAQPARAALTTAISFPLDLRQGVSGASATVDATLSATVVGVTDVSLDVSSAAGLTNGPASGVLTGPGGTTELFSLRPSGAATLTAYDLAVGTPGRWTLRVSWGGGVTGVAELHIR